MYYCSKSINFQFPLSKEKRKPAESEKLFSFQQKDKKHTSPLWVPWAQAQHPWPAKTNPRASKGKGPDISRPTNAGPTLRPDISRDSTQTLAGPQMLGQPSARALRDFITRTACLGRAFTFPSGNSPKRSCQSDLHFTSVSSFINLHRRLRRNREVHLLAVIS